MQQPAQYCIYRTYRTVCTVNCTQNSTGMQTGKFVIIIALLSVCLPVCLLADGVDVDVNDSKRI